MFVGMSAINATVPVDVGSVNVPVFAICEIIGFVKVLFVNVSLDDAVIYPAPFESSLLFVGMSEVNATVPVAVGRVSVPVFTIEPMTGAVIVLLVKVSLDDAVIYPAPFES